MVQMQVFSCQSVVDFLLLALLRKSIPLEHVLYLGPVTRPVHVRTVSMFQMCSGQSSRGQRRGRVRPLTESRG